MFNLFLSPAIKRLLIKFFLEMYRTRLGKWSLTPSIVSVWSVVLVS